VAACILRFLAEHGSAIYPAASQLWNLLRVTNAA